MCGIAGLIERHGTHVEPAQLESMIALLAHRGPDARGISVRGGAGLAHARLSIIDLAGGAQPMSNADGTVWITFNGEIFNYLELREELIRKGHRFASRSDTEVILHLYQEEGENCVQRMNGQWAFAIWDAPKKRLFLSRDRIGVRPLFYTQTAKQFLFASEIKALLACPDVSRELDLIALDQIFTFWVTLPGQTAFKKISQLPPGHNLVYENGTIRTWQYWSLQYIPERNGRDDEKRLSEELLSLLLDATRIRLRSDVPVGSYLSGGLDSTIITALTKSVVEDRLRTFSVSFDDAEFDESAYQQEASAFLSTQHSDVRCRYDDIARIFPDVIRHTEQPILRTAPAPLYQLAKLVHESGYKVVLTGEGADEMLGGYDIFKEAKIRRFWGQQLQSRMRPRLLKRLYPYMDGIQRQPVAYLQRFFRVSVDDLASPFFSHLPRWGLTCQVKMFFSDGVRAETQSYDPLSELEQSLPSAFAGWKSFNQAEYLEASSLLPGYILSSQGDRMAMAHSVEGRYPFLDHRVVEFAAKLPPDLKMKVLDQKYLLKQAAHGRIPASIETRHKQPYRAPDGKSFFLSGETYIDQMLAPEQIKKDAIFNPQTVSGLVAKFKTGRPTSVREDMALVGILSTQLLLHHFVHQKQPSDLISGRRLQIA